MDLDTIKGTFSLVGQAIDVIKEAKDLMPKGAKRDKAETTIMEAEQALALAEGKAAQSLGYELCRCTWPPQITLRIEEKDNICPKCHYGALSGRKLGDEGPCE